MNYYIIEAKKSTNLKKTEFNKYANLLKNNFKLLLKINISLFMFFDQIV